jgi:hypothetical protein
MFHSNKFTHNNKGTVGNSVIYVVRDKGLYNKDTSQAAVSCKGVSEWKSRMLVEDGHQPKS